MENDRSKPQVSQKTSGPIENEIERLSQETSGSSGYGFAILFILIGGLWGTYSLLSAAYEFLKAPVGFKGDGTFLDVVLSLNYWGPFGLIVVGLILFFVADEG